MKHVVEEVTFLYGEKIKSVLSAKVCAPLCYLLKITVDLNPKQAKSFMWIFTSHFFIDVFIHLKAARQLWDTFEAALRHIWGSFEAHSRQLCYFNKTGLKHDGALQKDAVDATPVLLNTTKHTGSSKSVYFTWNICLRRVYIKTKYR